jgi:hypothetical protein
MKSSSFSSLVSTSLLSFTFVVVLASCGKKESITPATTYSGNDENARKVTHMTLKPAKSVTPVTPADPKDGSIKQIKKQPFSDVLTEKNPGNHRATQSTESPLGNDVFENENIGSQRVKPLETTKFPSDFQIKDEEIRKVVSIDKGEYDALASGRIKKDLTRSTR